MEQLQLDDLLKGNMRHVVITGGEPLLQKTALAQLCRKLKEIPGLHLTMESNGSPVRPGGGKGD